MSPSNPRVKFAIYLLLLVTLVISMTSSLSSGEKETKTPVPKISLEEQSATRLFKKQQQELELAVKAYFEKAIATGDVVGVGVSIVKGDAIVLADGYGKRKTNAKAQVDGQTVFRLGSLSKGFAGVLAADLKAEGKLNWTDKVSDYIPDFQLGGKDHTSQITLANILSHTSGAPYHSYTNLVEAGLSLTEIAPRFKDVRPISSPGSLYSYQNALFALSGLIMQKAGGSEITTALEDKFFKPLEMCSTTMDYETLIKTENVALPHTKRRRGWQARPLTKNYFNAIAAGGINASANDMGKWMRFLLGHNPEVMSTSALNEAFNPIIEITGHSKYYQRWPGHLSSYYGYGWRIHKFMEAESDQQKTMWHHGGSVNNYRNEIAVFPDADLGICVLLNSNSRIARTVVPDLYNLVKTVFKQQPSDIASNAQNSTVSSL